MPDPGPRTILFTLLEPSGDILAARLIRELKERDPSLRFVGFGGPKMQEAGAELIANTVSHGTIGLSTGLVSEIKGHRQRIKQLGAWLDNNDILAHVPVDSPAANWALCNQVRKRRPNATIVHLACPQIWSWASWRIRRLRRLTDRVLCLLPFEPDWLKKRGVDGVYVGHPVFEEVRDVLESPVDETLPDPGAAGVRLALMPGSRSAELKKNWPTMLRVYQAAKRELSGLVGVVAARQEEDQATLRTITQEAGLDWPDCLTVIPVQSSQVIRWSDVVLVKSGTSTLQVTAMNRPMVAFYNLNPVKWHGVARWVINLHTFALPNIISEWKLGKRAVPEFVPHFGAPEPILNALLPLLKDESARQQQRDALSQVNDAFGEVHFAKAAADGFLGAIERSHAASPA